MPSPTLVSIIAVDELAWEGDTYSYGAIPTTGEFQVIRHGNFSQSLDVQLSYSGSATPTVDYQSLPSSVHFNPGQEISTFRVRALDDLVIEEAESVVAHLEAGTGYYVDIDAFEALVSIRSDDSTLPVISIEATDAAATERTDMAVFTIQRTGDLSRSLTFFLDITGSASPDLDYMLVYKHAPNWAAGWVSEIAGFAAGQAELECALIALTDYSPEGTETVQISLIPTAYQYDVGLNANATLTISDHAYTPEDIQPYAIIVNNSPPLTEPSSSIGVGNVFSSGSIGDPIYTVGGSATGPGDHGNPIDYGPITGYYHFPPYPDRNYYFLGGTGVVDDLIVEDTETIVLTLQSSLLPYEGYSTVPGWDVVTHTILDNDGPIPDTPISVEAVDAMASEALDSINYTSTAAFRFTRDIATSTDIYVGFTLDGGAILGSDFSFSPDGANNGVYFIRMDPYITSRTILITPLDDALPEDFEAVQVRIVAGPNYHSGAFPSDFVVIHNDDWQNLANGNVPLDALQFATADPVGSQLIVENVIMTETPQNYHATIKYLTVPPERRVGAVFNGNDIEAIRALEDPVRREIYQKMSSHPTEKFEFSTRNKAIEHFDFRMRIIDIMRRMNGGGPAIDFGYPATVGATEIDENYWSKNKQFTPQLVFDQNVLQGRTPYIAIDRLETSRTRADCVIAAQTTVFLAAARVAGEKRFNLIHTSRALRLGSVVGRQSEAALWKHVEVTKRPRDVTPAAYAQNSTNWIPGDWLYMQNKDDYSRWYPTGLLAGEQCFYVGKNSNGVPEFSGLGMQNYTEAAMRDALKRGYEENPNHTVPNPNVEIRFTTLRRLKIGD